MSRLRPLFRHSLTLVMRTRSASSTLLNKRPCTNLSNQCRMMSGYTVVEKGTPNTLDYRIFYEKDGVPVSSFHDIPLYADDSKTVCNMVVEIPRYTNAKMEICKEEALNPIKQDVKKGKLRFVNNCFPYHGYIWNYGALPQTWEDPTHVDANTGAAGDNDPLDCVEIGTAVASRGEIKQVKVLGVIAMIDEGETDWKLAVIDVKDPMADKLNDIEDVRTHMPGMLEATRDWFRIYKFPTGKPMNEFAYNGEWKDRAFAMKVIEETNGFWKALMNNKDVGKDVNTMNTTQNNSSGFATKAEALELLNKQPVAGVSPPICPSTENQVFVKRTVSEAVCA